MTKLDLKGLKITWIGLLLTLISGVLNGIGSQNTMSMSSGTVTVAQSTSPASALGGILSIVAFIVTVVGLSMAKNLSEHFKKARNLMIIVFIVSFVIAVIAVSVVAVQIINMSVTGANPVSAGLVIFLLVVIVILIVLSLVTYRHLLKGCQETAVLCNENELGEKFLKMWKLFLIGIILVFAGVVVLFVGIIGASAAGAASFAAVIGAMVPGVVIVIAGMIIALVFQILLLVRIAKLCSYDGTEIGAGEKPEEETSDSLY